MTGQNALLKEIHDVLVKGWGHFFQEKSLHVNQLLLGSTQEVWKVNDEFVLKRYSRIFDDELSGGPRWERALSAHVLLRGLRVIPRSFGVRAQRNKDGNCYVYHLREYMEGEVLNASTVRHHVHQVVEVLQLIHKQKVPVTHRFVLSGLETPRHVFKRARDLLRIREEHTGLLELDRWVNLQNELRKQVREVSWWLESHGKAFRGHFVLRHGDPNPENYILVGDEGEAQRIKVIDWDYASWGLKELDFALLVLYPEIDENTKARVLQEYEEESRMKVNHEVLQGFMVAGSILLSAWGFHQAVMMSRKKEEKKSEDKYRSLEKLWEYSFKQLQLTREYMHEG